MTNPKPALSTSLGGTRGVVVAALALTAIAVLLLTADRVRRAPAAAPSSSSEPPVRESVEVYKTAGDRSLRALLYEPGIASGGQRPGAALFHGGGWSIGSPEWMAVLGRRLAQLGMVAVSFEYRLSDQRSVTPLEAMADARDGMRWLRRNADRLQVDTGRIAAVGVSAGAQLAAAAAIFDRNSPREGTSAAPNALVMWYPALGLARDRWVARILLGRASVASISPLEHVRPGMPPAIIFVGGNDSLTPAATQLEFCERMRRAGNQCSVTVYPGLGHLFMTNPWGEGDGPRDSVAIRDSRARAEEFLRSHGFLPE